MEHTVKVTDQEQKVLDAVRSLKYGDVTVIMKEGKPIRIEVKESVMV
ncbi:MAG: DUF2292 domain-containing protein [Bacillota bacterium]|nr:DUF2292 domain-containing protein [Bacillota bacterium]